MDTTEKYIIISSKALRIQELWKPSIGDFYACKYDYAKTLKLPQIGVLCSDIDIQPQNYTWLPKQDQLQKIYIDNLPKNIRESEYIRIEILDDFQNWVFNKCPNWMLDFDSLEQLWLAFVMQENYNSYWNELHNSWLKFAELRI